MVRLSPSTTQVAGIGGKNGWMGGRVNRKYIRRQTEEISGNWRQLATSLAGELGRSYGCGGWTNGEISRQECSSLCADPHADCEFPLVMSASYHHTVGGHDLQGQLYWQPDAYQHGKTSSTERK